ncbi:MAG: PAS domain S-box protein [Candidatus Electrothrix sp. AR3]|nr:PAS domain S-box protein [Candidatus Electrothrix sp. AR3]
MDLSIVHKIQLKVFIPCAMVSSVLLTIFFAFIGSRGVILDRVERTQRIAVRDRMNTLQGIVEHLQETSELDIIRQTISLYGAAPDHNILQLSDHQGKIIASTKYQTIGQYWLDQPVSSTVDSLENTSILVQLSEDKKWLISYASICHAKGQKLRSMICGILYYRQDLQYHKIIALTDLRLMILQIGAGSILSGFFLWLLLHLCLTKRATSIIEALEEYKHGKTDVQITMSGVDELAKIATAMNTLFNKIQQDALTIRQSEKRFRSLVENVPGAVYRIDLVSSEEIQFLSSGIKKISGYSATELLKNAELSYFSLIDPEYRQEVKKYIYDHIQCDKPFSIEYPLRNADGSRRWVFDRGRVIMDNEQDRYVDGIIIDITEKKAIEKALQEASVLKERVIAASPIGLAIYDQKGQCMVVNNAMTQITDTRTEKLLGQNYNEIEHWQESGVIEVASRSLAQQKSCRHEGHMTTSKGRDVIISYVFTPFQVHNEQRLLLMMDDISERHNSEEKLKSALNEKETLLKEIHHRVKNNMQIVVSLMFLQAQHIENKEALTALLESQGRIKSMGLVHEILYQSDDLSKVSFKEYIETLIHSLRESYKKNEISIQIKVEGIELPVDAAIPCGLILNELLSNSFKHAFKNGQAGSLKISFVQKNNAYRLSVKDNGCGLPDNYDWQSSPSLGFNLIRTLSAQLDAQLEFKNDNGLHCHLFFRLPMLSEE